MFNLIFDKVFKFITAVLLPLALFWPTKGQAQSRELWRVSVTNDGPGTFRSARAAAIDGAGNFILSGSLRWIGTDGVESNDFIVMNLDSAGVRLWQHRFPGAGRDGRQRLVLDPAGNLFIGDQWGEAGQQTDVVLKLSPNGDLLWRIDAADRRGTRPAIATDVAGNLFLASVSALSTNSFLVARYDPDGHEIWRAPAVTEGLDQIRVSEIRVDPKGRVAFIGSGFNGTDWSGWIGMWTVDGTLLWRYPAASQTDELGALADLEFAADGGLYVAGNRGTARFAADGTRLWSLANDSSILHVDRAGRLLLGGVSGSSSATLRFVDADGGSLWRLSNPAPPFGTVLDAAGNGVMGVVSPAHWIDPLRLVGFDLEGHQLWQQTLTNLVQNFSGLTVLISASNAPLYLVADAYNPPANPVSDSFVVVGLVPEELPAGSPQIINEPEGVGVIWGKEARFRVGVEGPPPLRYQWYRQGAPLPGKTNSFLTIPNAYSTDTGDYHAVVSNALGAVGSRIAELTLFEPPYFYGEPTSESVAINGTAVFTAAALGSEPLTRQWFFNGLPLAGQTNNVLVFTNANASVAGPYQLVATNSTGAITSLVARLIVTTAVRQEWSRATAIYNNSDPSLVQVEGTDGAVYVARGNGLAKYSASGQMLWQTTNDTRALALDGTGGLLAVGFRSIIHYAGDGAILWTTNLSASLIARAGDQFVVSDGIPLMVIDRAGNVTGAIAPECADCQWTKLLALKPFPDGQFLLAGLVKQGTSTDEIVLARFSLDGQTTWMVRPGIPVAWWLDDQIGVAVGSDGSTYMTAAYDSFAASTNQPSQVTLKLGSSGQELWRHNFAPPPSTSIQVHLALDSDDSVIVSGLTNLVKWDRDGRVVWRTPLRHPLFGASGVGAIATGNSGAIYLIGATRDWFEPMAVLEKLDADGNSIWVTRLGRLNGQWLRGTITVGLDGTVQVAGADVFDGWISRLSQPANVVLPRVISDPVPVAQAIPVGADATISAQGEGAGPIRYQWIFEYPEHGWVFDIPGATNAALTLTNVTALMSGSYYVDVVSPAGATVSQPAFLDVGELPFLYLTDAFGYAAPRLTRLNEGGSVTLQASLSGLPAQADQWQWSFDGTPIPGATNSFLSIADGQTSGTGNYAVSAGNRYGATSNAVRVIVTRQVTQVSSWSEPAGVSSEYEYYRTFRPPRLAVNNTGEVYLLGSSVPSEAEGPEWFLIKIASDGQRLWRVTHRAPGGFAAGAALALDPQGRPVVTGRAGSLNNPDAAVIQYDTNGSLVWETTLSLAANGWEYPGAMTVDAAGNVFVAGIAFRADAANTTAFLAKLSAQGETLWITQSAYFVAALVGLNESSGLASAGDGGVFWASEAGLVRLGPDGSELWRVPGRFTDLALDSTGNVVVVGEWIGRLTPTGQLLWSVTAPRTTSVRVVGTEIVATGSSRVTKLNEKGEELWTSSFPVATTKVESTGDIYTTGAGLSALFVRKVNPAGTELWLATSAIDLTRTGYASDVVLTPQGDIVSAHLIGPMNAGAGAEYMLTRHRQTWVPEAPTVTVAPRRLRVSPEEPIHLAGDVTGQNPLEFQWLLNGAPLAGETNLALALTNLVQTNAFQLIVANDFGVAVSADATVESPLPFLGTPSRDANNNWTLPVYAYSRVLIESSKDLVWWEIIDDFWIMGTPRKTVTLPPMPGSVRFYRVRQIPPLY